MTQQEKERLVQAARQARSRSYAPYSHFAVGAAVQGESGTIYTGCNIECASFSATCCAERVAVYHAVAAGEKSLCAVAVAGGAQGQPVCGRTAPCGICRQVLSEFAEKDMPVLMAVSEEAYEEVTLESLLPLSFGPQDLRE
ncbi:MAG TPA: cytidine deaminase [Candidatus Ruthenibacterium avium]|uniref:Cytidine deaminase n=1 Tax=Candidatus Ruthenibacterium avium TaxID=2838751 RepID=A0A9D2M2V6_9FIRM|nr:cytidine deaminase [Candidatus Ruthenibacterium avium]